MPDLLTRAEAYEAINDPTNAAAVSSDRDVEFIDIWLPAVSRRIKQLCGPVIIETVTDERHDGDVETIWLRQSPADSITTLTEYQHGVAYTLTAEVDDTLPDYGYLIDQVGTTTFVRRRQSGCDWRFYPGRNNIKITYEAGRYANTEAVDPLFKMAASAILRRLWSRESPMWASGGDPFTELAAGGVRFYKTVDPMVAEFLPNELLPPGVA